MKRIIVAALVGAALLTGCTKAEPAKPAPTTAAAPAQIKSITAPDLYKRLKAGEKPLIVDVREPHEFEAGHIEGALLSPLGTVEQGVANIAKDKEIILVCRSGNRSAQAYQVLADLGYTNLLNMEGGMNAWEKLGAPVK